MKIGLRWNLHTARQRADWELIPKEKRNVWQRIAFSTKGALTPANVTSVAGTVLVGIGLWYIYTGDLSWGFVCIAVGRLADILDGIVAQVTGTKSNVGEAVDAGLDKLTIIASLTIFFVAGTVPFLAATLIGMRNILNIVVGLLGKAHKKVLHPSRAGKFAAALEWASILLFIISAVFSEQGWQGARAAAFTTASVLLGLTLLLGFVAIKNYSLRVFNIRFWSRRA